MEIKSLTLKSKRNTNVFVAKTDSGDFDLHSDIIVKNGIKKGQVSEENFYKSVEESSRLIGFNLCVSYIGNKLKTEKQIKDYLYKKGYHKTDVEEIINKLKDYKIINDKTYAESYVNANKNFSKNKLKQKLYSAGVKNLDVEDCVSDIDDLDSCIYNANKYLKNKVVDKTIKEKLIRRLMGMGYNYDTIKSAIRKLNLEFEED